MKKFILLLICTMLFITLFTGCGSSSQYPQGSLQNIVDRGFLKVGVKNNVVGFGFQDILKNEYDGLEIDIGRLIAQELGVDVEFTTVNTSTRTELLDSGDLDCVIATFTITDERKKRWNFTTAYYTDYVTALVEKSSGITTLEDIVGTTVGVSTGANSARSMVAAMVDKGLISSDNFNPSTFDPSTWNDQVSFRQYDDYPTISTALASGEVSTFCVDKSILSYYNSDSRDFINDTFAPQEYGVATSLDTEFAVYCQELITKWLEDGTIDELIKKHGV